MDYQRGPAVKLGQGDHVKTWGSEEGAYELADDPTPAEEIRATITPRVGWAKVALVACGAGYIGLCVFVWWIF